MLRFELRHVMKSQCARGLSIAWSWIFTYDSYSPSLVRLAMAEIQAHLGRLRDAQQLLAATLPVLKRYDVQNAQDTDRAFTLQVRLLSLLRVGVD